MPFSPRFEQALIYACHVHAGQVRKKTDTPYVLHLLAVASLVGEYGGDEDQVIAALLHDAPEDQGGRERLSDIRLRFGDQVAKIVEGCTDTFETPKPPWRERKEAYVKHLARTPKETLLVSAADKLHNARSIMIDVRNDGDRVFEKFNGKKDGTLWYYRAVTQAFEKRGRSALTDELRRTVEELHLLTGVEEKF